MINIEVQSNTEFSQTYCACLQKRDRTSNNKRVSNGHIGHQTGIKKTNNIMKEKRNLMYLCYIEMTIIFVFNILILDLNKEKKQN